MSETASAKSESVRGEIFPLRQSSRAVRFLRLCILALLLVVGFLPAVHLRFGGVFPDISILLTEVSSEGGFAFRSRISQSTLLSLGRLSSPSVFENRIELKGAHARLEEIQQKGGGRYLFWNGEVYFSSSDNTDPRTNGRQYSARSRRAVPAAIVVLGCLCSFLSLVFLVRGVRLRHVDQELPVESPAPFAVPTRPVKAAPQRRGVFETGWILMFSVVLALVLAEGVFRGIDLMSKGPAPQPDQRGAPSLPLVWDNRLSWIFRPNVEFQFRRWEGKSNESVVTQRSNELGFVDREPRKPIDGATKRVMILGDSFVEALRVGMNEKVGRYLEQSLTRRESESRIDVLTFGRADTGQATQYSYWKEFGSKFKPQAVVLVMAANDLRDNHPDLSARFHGWNPLYPPRFSVALSDSSPNGLLDIAPYSEWESVAKVPHDTPERVSMFPRLMDQSALVRFFRQSGDSAADFVESPPPEHMYQGQFVDSALLDSKLQADPIIKASYTITSRLLDRFKDEVRSQGGELVLFVGEPILKGSSIRRNVELQFFKSWVEKEAKRLKVPFGSFSSAKDTDPPSMHEYVSTDGEWNEAGHAAAAEILEPLIRKALRRRS